MQNLNWLKDKHKGESCVLICNGPSLNSMDLSFLKHHTCIGLNKIFLGINKFQFYPKYLVAVNELVLRQSQRELKNLTCTKFISNRCKDIYQPDFSTFILNTTQPLARFSEDLNNGIDEGGTVTYAALQIVYYLGFREVVIIGMDHSFVYSGAPNDTANMGKQDPNHFCGSYFANQEWHNPDLFKSEESYQIAKHYFDRDGRVILDATVGGKCKIFEKVDYLDYFKLKPKSSAARPLRTEESLCPNIYSRVHIGDISLQVDLNESGGRHYLQRQHVEEYYSRLFPLLKDTLNPSVVVDIGANYGFTASVFAQQLEPESLVLVEPDPKLEEVLKQNVNFNATKVNNVTVLSALVGKVDGESNFSINPHGSQDNRVLPAAKNWQTCKVKSYTLENLLRRYAASKSVFIKIDTQGYDPVVITSGAKYLLEHSNWFIRSEFAPLWMESQGLNPFEFLCWLTRHFNVYEAPTRIPYNAKSSLWLGSKLSTDEAFVSQFIEYVEKLNHDRKGWIDIFVTPKHANWYGMSQDENTG